MSSAHLSRRSFLRGLGTAMALPWDFLNPISDAAAGMDSITKYIVFLLAAAFCLVAFLGWHRTRTQRLLFVWIAFALFAAEWALKILDMHVSQGVFLPDSSENVFELLILASLFLAIFKKEKK